jgi:hypothetical protein
LTIKHQDVSAELNRFAEIRQHLSGKLGEVDEATLQEALIEIAELHDAIAETVRSALEDEAAASRLQEEMKEKEVLLRSLEQGAESKRDTALRAMMEMGLESLDARGIKIDIQHSATTLIIGDEGLIPDTFKHPRPPLVDYQAIRDALNDGASVPGATLASAEPCLVVRAS